MRRLVVVVLLALLVAGPVSAGKPQPLDWVNPATDGQSTYVVEQQNDWPWPAPELRVVNPLSGCTWDVNDRLTLTDSGYLNPAVPVSKAVCMVTDHNPTWRSVFGLEGWWSSERGRFGFQLDAPSASLQITACYTPQDRCFTPAPVWQPTTRTYRWTVCSQVVYTPDDPVLTEIPGSNGGLGVVSQILTTVVNTGARRVPDVRLSVGVQDGAGLAGPPIGPGCADTPPTAHVAYPFTWDIS